jgi:TorA maturation chaperone TorD
VNATTNSALETLAQADLLFLAARALRVTSARALALPDAAEAWELAERSGLTARPDGAAALGGLIEAAGAADPASWSDERTRLFEGNLLCPPNETAFLRRDRGAILADVCGFYRAFGFDLAPEAGEKADHIVTELEFTAMLLVLLARARERGNVDAEIVTREALAGFVRDHLDEWVAAFCEKLGETTAFPLYRAAATVLREAFETVIERNGLPRATLVAPAACMGEGGTPYECDAVQPGRGLPPYLSPASAASTRSRAGTPREP